MGRVLLGAILLVIVGGLIGYLPSHGSIAIQQQPGIRWQVGEPLRVISMMIGAAAGAVVGAVAGAVSAQPGTRPVPRWVWLAILVAAALIVVALWLLHPSADSAAK